MSRSVRWAVLGCSDIVQRRAAAAILEREDNRIVAIYSRNKERSRAFADQFDIGFATNNVEEILDDRRIDAVYVATEVARHAPLTIAAATAGKHVLVEKPMAVTTDEAAQMITAAERHGVHLAVAYYARFLPKVAAMRQAITAGQLGHPARAIVAVLDRYNLKPDNPRAWRLTTTAGGNRIADIGSHRLDLLAHLLGRPDRATGFVDRATTTDHEGPDTETGLIQFEQGTHVTVMASSNIGHSGERASLEIYGTDAALLSDPWSAEPMTVTGTTLPPVEVRLPSNVHSALIDDFTQAIIDDRPPRFTGHDGIWATAMIEAIYDSSRRGRTIDIPNLLSGTKEQQHDR